MASYTISFRTAANLKAKRTTLPFCTDGGGLPGAPAEEAGWLPEPQANSYGLRVSPELPERSAAGVPRMPHPTASGGRRK